MIEYRYVIVSVEEDGDNPLSVVEGLLSEAWVPLREVPMPSSVGGSNVRSFPPCCMVVMCRASETPQID